MARSIEDGYNSAKEKFAEFGVDTDMVLSILKKIPISINCWQGDDLGGFEKEVSTLNGGGILVDRSLINILYITL